MGRTAQPNPWIGRVYFPDNPRMSVPPAWFLAQIHDYDSELVILPSRQRPFAYVIARRLRGKRWGQARLDTATHPDTKMCMAHNLIPVCLMFKTGPTWNVDRVLQSLRARDLWNIGGGNKAADLLEEQEAADKAKIRADFRDDMWNRSGDAWRSYQRRTGQRTSVPGPARTGAAPSNSSSSRTVSGVATTPPLWVA